MTEEVYKNWVKLLNLSRKNFIALKLKNFNDEINNFFLNGYCSKIRNFTSFRVPPATLLQDEDRSRIRTLSWNLQARYRNCRMKLIAWMIQEIFRMLNRSAVEIPTLPVSQCHSHLIQFLKECSAVLSECRAAEKGRQAFGTHMVYRETFLKIQFASSSSPYPQELNQWSSSIEEPLHSSTVEEWETNTRSRSDMPVWTVSQKFCHLQWRRLFKELLGRPTTTADFRSSFW